ncbi:MAG TPA: imidazole glycerol phosphate synthase subunit HisH [Candidatus Deferrimicrobium sp.]|nr:imidazole glycerol phosphate synthase subunit HisH [Candidatus Deferrimicrobium sp.]
MVNLAIINYEMGNLKSISSGLKKVGATIQITKDPEIIRKSDGIVIPGVGAFGDAMKNLIPVKQLITEEVEAGKPFLGVCLGFQLIFDDSTEFGIYEGFGLLKGHVIKLPETIITPHIGWNQIIIRNPDNPLVKGVPNKSYVYFVHSFYPEPENSDIIIAETHYGLDFASIVGKDNIFATQFHPEKSSKVGLQILKNFLEFVKI